MMTLVHLVQALRELELFGKNQRQIVGDILVALGSEATPSENTIKAWLSGKRAAKGDSFIPSQGISEAGFLKYFDEKLGSEWKKLQGILCEVDDEGVLDCETDDKGIFLWSLLQLFCSLVGLPKPVSLIATKIYKQNILGREKDLQAVSMMLENSKFLFLTGMGGIGKSCVALAYAYEQQEKGWLVQHVICEFVTTLKNILNNLQFEGLDDKEDFGEERRAKVLQNQMKPTLIIFDNVDILLGPTESNYISQILEKCANVKFLVTSRPTPLSRKENVYHIKPLGINSLLKLYSYHRFENPEAHDNYINERRGILIKLFGYVGHHTLTVEILAKLASRCYLDEKEIFDSLEQYFGLPSEKVYVNKDGYTMENDLVSILRNVFSMMDFSDREKNIMRHMTLVPFSGIDKKVFEELMKCADKEPARRTSKEIKKLIDTRWILLDEETFRIRLHPVIAEVILSSNNVRPTHEICKPFSDKIVAKREEAPQFSQSWHDLNKANAHYLRVVLYREFVPIIPYLKDEYGDPLRRMDRVLREILNDKPRES